MIVLFITIFYPPKKKFIPTPYFRPRGASEVKKAYFTFLAEPFGAMTFFFPYGNDLGMHRNISSKEVPTWPNKPTFWIWALKLISQRPENGKNVFGILAILELKSGHMVVLVKK